MEVDGKESSSSTAAAETRVKVIVKINDMNDNEPEFNRPTFSFAVSPRASVGTTLNLVESGIDSIHVSDTDKGLNGSFSLMIFRVSGSNSSSPPYSEAAASVLYDDYADFEVVPKVALNEANLIIKVKNSTNLLSRMGSIEHYHVSYRVFYCLPNF